MKNYFKLIYSRLLEKAEKFCKKSSGFLNFKKKLESEVWRKKKSAGHLHSEGDMLYLLTKVFAFFVIKDGNINKSEIEFSLKLLQEYFSDRLSSQIKNSFNQALRSQDNLDDLTLRLNSKLNIEQKILLLIHLYFLVNRATNFELVFPEYLQFCKKLGLDEAQMKIVDILSSDKVEKYQSDLFESLSFSSNKKAEVFIKNMPRNFNIQFFRYKNLILLKNLGKFPVIVGGYSHQKNSFCRVYQGHRVYIGDYVLSYDDIKYYFDCKRGLKTTQVYFSYHSKDNSFFLEKEKTPNSVFFIDFSLSIKIKALCKNNISINGKVLEIDESVELNYFDSFKLQNGEEIQLSSLKYKAIDLGSNYQILTNKSEYLVSNNPDLLAENDILLSESNVGEVLLKIVCHEKSNSASLHILKSSHNIYVNDIQIYESFTLKDDDRIVLGENQFLYCNFTEGIIQEEKNVINTLELSEISYKFGNNKVAMDSISLSANRGDLICVMGPSGCGKTVMLRSIAGDLKPQSGNILLNDNDLYENFDKLKSYISFAPHEEAFDPLLTVAENIFYSSAVRNPSLKKQARRNKVEARLSELGLLRHKDSLAGDSFQKKLSGGERKRLNIGLDLIGSSDIYLFDEPTSGLSSKDSEHLIDILLSISYNKIIFVSIHQPSLRIFNMFDKVLLLDMGGKLCYFGSPQETLSYFYKFALEQNLMLYDAVYKHNKNISNVSRKFTEKNMQPEYIFDILEQPVRDASGEIVYDRSYNSKTVSPIRRFSPKFWQEKFLSLSFYEEIIEKKTEEIEKIELGGGGGLPNTKKHTISCYLLIFFTFFKRNFKAKLRNKINLIITLAGAPLLAILVSLVLHHSEGDEYLFATAVHIPTYIFLSLVIAMFLGLSNSVDEIIKDKQILRREKNQSNSVTLVFYIFTKFISLAFFSVIQTVVYLLIGNTILEIREMFSYYFLWVFLSNIVGISIGIFVSSMVNDSRIAINFIPIILIPQIILGGALIKYEEMNQNLDFVHSISKWLDEKQEERSKLEVPFFCEFMPLRWTYESLIINQALHNPVNKAMSKIQREIDELKNKKNFTEAERERFYVLKASLPIVPGVREETPRKIAKKMHNIINNINEKVFNPDEYLDNSSKLDKDYANSDEIFINRKVGDLFKRAKFERVNQYNPRPLNVFLGERKTLFFVNINTLYLNFIVILFIVFFFLVLLFFRLKKVISKY